MSICLAFKTKTHLRIQFFFCSWMRSSIFVTKSGELLALKWKIANTVPSSSTYRISVEFFFSPFWFIKKTQCHRADRKEWKILPRSVVVAIVQSRSSSKTGIWNMDVCVCRSITERKEEKTNISHFQTEDFIYDFISFGNFVSVWPMNLYLIRFDSDSDRVLSIFKFAFQLSMSNLISDTSLYVLFFFCWMCQMCIFCCLPLIWC